MKIVSWNLERPKKNQIKKNDFILRFVNSFDADIIFLTETNSVIDLGNKYHKLESKMLEHFQDNQKYDEGENRISIFSKYPFTEKIETYNPYNTVCGKIETKYGEFILYGSIIGYLGGRDDFFKTDLEQQKNEFKKLTGNIIFSGDFNIAFSGWKYPSIKVVEETKAFFDENNLEIMTKNNNDCAIHIIINKAFLKDKNYTNQMITIDAGISDHNLVICEISSQ